MTLFQLGEFVFADPGPKSSKIKGCDLVTKSHHWGFGCFWWQPMAITVDSYFFLWGDFFPQLSSMIAFLQTKLKGFTLFHTNRGLNRVGGWLVASWRRCLAPPSECWPCRVIVIHPCWQPSRQLPVMAWHRNMAICEAWPACGNGGSPWQLTQVDPEPLHNGIHIVVHLGMGNKFDDYGNCETLYPTRERGNISHPKKRKIIFKSAVKGRGYVSSREGMTYSCLPSFGKNKNQREGTNN